MCLTVYIQTAGSVSGAALHKIVEWLELNAVCSNSRLEVSTCLFTADSQLHLIDFTHSCVGYTLK